MRYAPIEGYKFRYRVSDAGTVEKLCGSEWVTLTPTMNGHRRAIVNLRRTDGTVHHAAISHLVAAAFIGRVPPGHSVIHKNSAKLDNEPENLLIVPQNKTSKGGLGKTVLKVDRWGVVVAVYRSSIEAAKKNYISVCAVRNRCRGLVADPYRLDGYDYRYES